MAKLQHPVFVSYVRENSEQVQRLCDDLSKHGVEVWLDQKDIKPGSRWKDAIREAIQKGTFFIACFSIEYTSQDKSYVHEELTLAIEELRQYPSDRAWFIPVLLSKCDVPSRSIGGGETLSDIQSVSLYDSWAEGVQKIVSVIRATQTDIQRTGHDRPIWVNNLLHACHLQVDNTILDVGRKFNPDLYVHRKIESAIKEFIKAPQKNLSPNCYLIVAPAGSGKTNLVCNLARAHISNRSVLLLLGGNVYLTKKSGILGACQSELQAAKSEIAFRSAEDCLHTLDRLGKELDCYSLIILDAINEYEHPIEMRKAIEDLFRKTRGKRIKLVITCRDYYWGMFKGPFWKKATINDLPAEVDVDIDSEEEDVDFSGFAENEYEQAVNLYLKYYEIIGRPVGKAAEQCRHPLLLRFFCEAYRGEEIGKLEDIRLKQLFDQYWNKKLESIADRMVKQGDSRLLDGLEQEIGTYILNIARHMLHHNVRAIPIEDLSKITGRNESHIDPKSPYGRIRDEFIILEETERGEGRQKSLQVAFVYEEFMEYVMARSLIVDWDKADCDDTKILAEIEALFEKYDSFTQIFGVIVYLALMLKTDRGLELWSLLANQGDRWQNVIFEAVRKLPEDQLDNGVFDAMYEMLSTGEQALQIKVLDALKIKRLGKLAPPNLVNFVIGSASHKQEPIARRAALALGNMPFSLDSHGFKKALSHLRKAVRINTVKALLMLKDNGTIALIIAALKDNDGDVRSSAANALGEIGDQRAVEPLIAALKDTEKERSSAEAAIALGKIGDQRAVEPLIAALKETKIGCRMEAAIALGKIGDQRAVEPLIAALKDRLYEVRMFAASALGEIGEPAVDPLIAALKETKIGCRMEAAIALGKIGDQRAVEPLIAALKDRKWKVRKYAVSALGEIGDKRAVEPLTAALKDRKRKWEVRKHAASALGEMGELAVDPLIAALKDTKMEVRKSVAEALRQIGTPQALETVSDYETEE